MLPETSSEPRVAIWVSGSPKHLLSHAYGTVHVIKQTSFEMKLNEQVNYNKALKIDWEIMQDMYSKCKKNTRRTTTIWQSWQPRLFSTYP
jgi:hypothetical protein